MSPHSPDGRGASRQRLARVLPPLVVGGLPAGLGGAGPRVREIPHYVLPGPLLVLRTLWTDGGSLLGSLGFTLRVAALALLGSAMAGGLLAVLLVAQARWIELSLLPYAVMLQVTPIVSIAPLILAWVNDPFLALLVCAWIVAFFPVLSNTTLGLSGVAIHAGLGLLSARLLRHWHPSALPAER